jgi:hypothetical protein
LNFYSELDKKAELEGLALYKEKWLKIMFRTSFFDSLTEMAKVRQVWQDVIF